MTTTAEVRSEAAIYAEGTQYTTDDLVRMWRDATDAERADGCQTFFERIVAPIRVTITVDGREIVRDAESPWDALQQIQEYHPAAVAVGPWCLRLSGRSEREYAASGAEDAPIVARMVR